MRFSEVTFDVRHLCANLSHLHVQCETKTVYLLENKQLKILLHFNRIYNCHCLERLGINELKYFGWVTVNLEKLFFQLIN